MLLSVIKDVCAVAVNVVFNIAPSLKLVTVNVLFKFCVPSAAVPTWTFKAAPTLLVSKTLICILYVLFTVVLTAWKAAKSFNLNLPLPVLV